MDYSLELDLAHPVTPEQSGYKVMSTKIEIKLKKAEGKWNVYVKLFFGSERSSRNANVLLFIRLIV